MNKDYDEFVQRMGSFDMDLETIPTKEDPVTHWGVTRKTDSTNKAIIGTPILIHRTKK